MSKEPQPIEPDVYDQALQITEAAGAVVIIGPGRVAASLTPDAAEATADRLREAAEKARRRGADAQDQGVS